MDINIFQYISIRAAIGFFLAFFLTFYLMPKFLKWAKNIGAHQPIYDLAPSTHQKKAGTTTMGGLVFVIATLIATIFTAKLNNPYVIGALLSISLFSLIGIKDDYSKITSNKNNEGLSAKMKIVYQVLASLVVIAMLFYANHPTNFYIPFYKHALFDLDFYSIAFWTLVMVASTNAVNLTDGLDGLATVSSIFALLTLGIIIYITGHAVISSYLLLPNIKLAGELTIVVASFAGSLIGFLWYNSHPAEVFMGDSGSLAIGGFLAYLAIVAKSEVLLLLIGFIFVFETVSVMIQVASFKIRKKRVFLMAPIHHHFEQKGWHENKVIVRFWIIAFMTNLIALASLKIR
jgi:phospho-N-acetylmuramoyl-pentapeptide-transferase